MAGKQIDLGPVQQVDALALGAPGRRTFRLTIRSRAGSAWLWLEKEELQVLGMTIEQLLGRLPLDPALASTVPATAVAEDSASAGERPPIEFKVGRLSMGYEESDDLFVLLAHEEDADPEGPPSLRCQASRRQLRTLAQQITAICAAGRPRCPLCGVPLNGPKHPCPRLN
jgi:uncharacterized repeat protein (TIGR03847 family)